MVVAAPLTAAIAAMVTLSCLNVAVKEKFIQENLVYPLCPAEPCRNGGTCTDIINATGTFFNCSCVPGYEGDLCETDVDECASNPCQNGGTCTNEVNGFSCECPTGWLGSTCADEPEVCYNDSFVQLQHKINYFDTASIAEGFVMDMSSDGLYLAIAASGYDSPVTNAGAVVVYSRTSLGEKFSNQSGVIQGDDYNNTGSNIGGCVSLDSDGTTLAVGAYSEDSNAGALRIFTRSGSTWSQQGSKITVTPSVTWFGYTCRLSGDGDTLVVASYESDPAPFWVFTRTGDNWTKHVDAPFYPVNYTGADVIFTMDISDDASTIAIAVSDDVSLSSWSGAVWTFADNGTTWVQQPEGRYIRGSNITAYGTYFGWSVCLSGDGNVLGAGSIDDTIVSNGGAMSIFTRSEGVWTEKAKITSQNITEGGYFGTACEFSADGTKLAVVQMVAWPLGTVELFSSDDGWETWTNYTSPLVPLLQTTTVARLGFRDYQLAVEANFRTVAVTNYYDNEIKGSTFVFETLQCDAVVEYACASNPCENGATCVSYPADDLYVCVCTAGATGANCETCITGWEGDDCEINIDECASNPCQNGGTCTDLVNSYSCTCTTAYGGALCEDLVYALLQPKLNLLNTANMKEAHSVSVSGDGLRVAQGAPSYTVPLVSSGTFTIYNRSSPGEIFADETGPLIVSTGGTNYSNTQTGSCVSLDYDGDTVVVGGPGYFSNRGAIWVFTRTGSVWSQQGGMITTGVYFSYFGEYCDISHDGNTVAVSDRPGSVAGIHIYTRNGSTWSAHASNPATPSDAVGVTSFSCFALSGDGSTLLVGALGADNDGTNSGAAWVFVDNGTAWVQQGPYLNSTAAAASEYFGLRCSISYNGSIAAIGQHHTNNEGAIIVFRRTGETWEEVSVVKSPTPQVSDYFYYPAISANGTKLAVGAHGAGSFGEVEVFSSPDAETWTPVGNPLTPTGATQSQMLSSAGNCFDISADGSVVAAGTHYDSSNRGAVWVYTAEP